MLYRLSLILSLILFILLLLNGSAIDRALHRSLLIFMILFGAIHLGLLTIHMVRSSSSAKAGENAPKRQKEEPANDA